MSGDWKAFFDASGRRRGVNTHPPTQVIAPSPKIRFGFEYFVEYMLLMVVMPSSTRTGCGGLGADGCERGVCWCYCVWERRRCGESNDVAGEKWDPPNHAAQAEAQRFLMNQLAIWSMWDFLIGG